MNVLLSFDQREIINVLLVLFVKATSLDRASTTGRKEKKTL